MRANEGNSGDYQRDGGKKGFERPTLNGAAKTWPTPRGEDSESAGNHPNATDSLTGAMRLWTTPQAHDVTKRGSGQKPCTAAGNACLARDATNWPTPDALAMNDGTSPEAWEAFKAREKAKGINGNGHGETLAMAAKTWPTPRTPTGGGESAERKKELGREKAGGGDLQAAAQMWNTPNLPNGGQKTRSGKRSGELLLEGQAPAVTTWATPRAHDMKDGAASGEAPTNGYLSRQAPRFSRPAPVIGKHGSELSPTTRLRSFAPRLNPAFVCWMMGWPWWWTNPARINFAAEAMESYRSKLHTRLSNLLEGSA